MPLVASALDDRPGLEFDGFPGTRTQFFINSARASGGPQAHWVDSTHEGALLAPHFHGSEQYQIFFTGDGRIGKHALRPVDVHYADSFTPYGPIVAGPLGFHFMTLRAIADPFGAQYMPQSRGVMKEHHAKAGRTFAQHVDVPELGSLTAVSLNHVLGPHDDGLAAYRLDLPPHSRAIGPEPAPTSGQHYMVVSGCLELEGRLHPARSLVFVHPEEPPLRVAAGDGGASVLVLCFPRRLP